MDGRFDRGGSGSSTLRILIIFDLFAGAGFGGSAGGAGGGPAFGVPPSARMTGWAICTGVTTGD